VIDEGGGGDVARTLREEAMRWLLVLWFVVVGPGTTPSPIEVRNTLTSYVDFFIVYSWLYEFVHKMSTVGWLSIHFLFI